MGIAGRHNARRSRSWVARWRSSDEQRTEFEAAAARSGSPRRLGAASVTAGPWSDLPSSNLPLALTNFIGRETELDEIATLIRERRLVTLTGAGGVGKTQTALQVGNTLGARGPTAQSALSGSHRSKIRPSWFRQSRRGWACGPEPNRPLLETLLAYLKNRALLLILDNCEHVIAEAAHVAGNLLANCARVRILATSREPLKVAGEHTYRLPSLSLPSAVALFTDCARAADHHFELSGENAPIVAELCGHLDGIPLAIELAAARVNLLSLRAIAEKLSDRFRLLSGGERSALPRQQTMRAAIDWSYDLLGSPEQRLFERLSVFVGGLHARGGHGTLRHRRRRRG